jgi:SAM-dependent methyltransferase
VSSGRVDFSKNASIYDRRHGAILPRQAAERLAAAASLGAASCVLDVGAGTGRVAIALASLGCHVVALDPAGPMLQELLKKSASTSIPCVIGEGARLPIGRAAVDAVVVARLLYLARDWKDVLREAVRVLKPGGRLLHEWSNGAEDEEWVQVREKIRSMFEREGIANPFHPGARTEAEVDALLVDEGMTPAEHVTLGPGPPMTVDSFLKQIVDGECSYTWAVPRDVAERCLPDVLAWAAARFDLTLEVPMPREIVWRPYKMPDAQL